MESLKGRFTVMKLLAQNSRLSELEFSRFMTAEIKKREMNAFLACNMRHFLTKNRLMLDDLSFLILTKTIAAIENYY